MNDLLKLAMDAALRAGEAILEIYQRDFEVEFKADDSPLTEADQAAHQLICDALEETGLPILSEESKAISYEDRKGWTKYWLVDPLDGTKEFIKRNGEFTVNIALIDNGRPVMGVVYAPVLQTVYCGVTSEGGGRRTEDGGQKTKDGGQKTEDREQRTGDGAWKALGCTGKTVDEVLDSSVSIPPTSDLRPPTSGLRIVASRSHCNEETVAFIQGLEKKFGSAELVSKGSSLKLCLVAEGAADIYPRIAPTMEWDTAAAQAVVEASGGRVVQYDPAISASHYVRDFDDFSEAKGYFNALSYNKPDLLNPSFVVFR